MVVRSESNRPLQGVGGIGILGGMNNNSDHLGHFMIFTSLRSTPNPTAAVFTKQYIYITYAERNLQSEILTTPYLICVSQLRIKTFNCLFIYYLEINCGCLVDCKRMNDAF